MNTILLTTTTFLAGMAFIATNTHSKADLEAAIIEAYNIGKQECPSDTHCIAHGQLSGLKRLTVADIEEQL